MVKLFFILLISMGQLHAASLSLIPEQSQVEQGRSLTLNMRYLGPTSPDELNVKSWQTQAFIEKRDRQETRLADGQIEVKQRLTLFPRKTGLLELGPLALGGAKSKPIDLMVTPALVNRVDITPSWAPLPSQLWQGESFETCVHMPLSEQRNRVKVELPEMQGFAWEQTQNRRLQRDGQLIAERCWRVSSQLPGDYRIELPPIIQRGRGRWTFYLPSQSVEVLPLPSYLPNSISVGKPDIRVQTGEQGWNISIQVVGGQVTQPLWGVRSALAKATGIATDQMVVANETIFVPFKRWSFGQISRAKITFFNTETGRLDAVDLPLKAPLKLPIIGIVLLSILAMAILVKATCLVRVFMQRRAKLQAFKAAINSATTADQLRTTLLAAASPEASPRFKTLQQWAEAQADQEATVLAHHINQLAFSPHADAPLNELKQRVINLFRVHL